VSDVFEAIVAPVRRAILDELCERDGQTLFELCTRLTMNRGIGVTRQGISQHLDVLESSGLIVTARHVLLSLWKIAVEGDRQRETITDGLAHRFRECATEKNSTLIRYDIQCVLRRIYDLTGNERVRSTGEELMKLEQDTKYKKKYATAWRSASARPRKQSSGTRSRSTRSSRIRKKFSPL
jgi:DNA-binding transcriptional ArsR family regulator